MIPFTESTILELERTQNQVVKYALGLPINSPGICAQIELGLRPFKQLLYEHQLRFYSKVLQLDVCRWVKWLYWTTNPLLGAALTFHTSKALGQG